MLATKLPSGIESEVENGFKKKDLKLKVARVIYICQCGKNFLSFPAIYTHARGKHGIKLKSKLKSGGFKRVVERNQQRIYFELAGNQYKNASNSHSQSSNNSQKNIINCVTNFKFINQVTKIYNHQGQTNIYGAAIKYLESCSFGQNSHSMIQISDTLYLLTQCLNSHYMIQDQKQIFQNYCQESTPQMLPMFLNFFILWYLPSNLHKNLQINHSIQNAVICDILQQFCLWLRTQQHTNMDCFINIQFVSKGSLKEKSRQQNKQQIKQE